jgi:hypothetical protein
MKHILLDTNVLVNYYERGSKSAFMRLLHQNAQQHRALLHISNVCIAEVFKIFASHCFCEKTITPDTYWRIKEQFSRDVTRSFRYAAPQLYHEFRLTAYHIVHADLVFRRAMEYLQAHDRDGACTPGKHISTMDLLLIAQGIEMNHLHGDDNVMVLTGDKLLYDIGVNLRAHDTPEEKAACIAQHPTPEILANIAPFRYPRVEYFHASDITNTMVAFLGGHRGA